MPNPRERLRRISRRPAPPPKSTAPNLVSSIPQELISHTPLQPQRSSPSTATASVEGLVTQKAIDPPAIAFGATGEPLPIGQRNPVVPERPTLPPTSACIPEDASDAASAPIYKSTFDASVRAAQRLGGIQSTSSTHSVVQPVHGDQGGGLGVLCNSTGASVAALAVTNIGRDMVVHNEFDLEELRRMESTIRGEIRAAIRAVPNNVGFSDVNALVITDALGETISLPWSIVPSYDDLHRMLVNHFRWKIGEQRVTERRYCVARAGGAEGGTLVMANDWDSIRENPEELVMSMLIEQVFKAEFQKLCPKCGKTRLGTYEDQGWRVWCNTRFILPGAPEHREMKQKETDDAAFRHVRASQVEVEVSARMRASSELCI